MYQKALRDVVVPPKMHPAHPARLVAVRERPLHQLRPAARQSRSLRPPDAPTIPIHRSLHLPSPPPAPPATLRLRYMTPKTRSGQTRHRPATTSRFPPAPPNGPAPPPPLRESPLASPCPPWSAGCTVTATSAPAPRAPPCAPSASNRPSSSPPEHPGPEDAPTPHPSFVSRRTMLRIAAFASGVVASTPSVRPRNSPAFDIRPSTHENIAACVSRSIRRRVPDIVE